jgi:seryl-tRNA synthetase
MIDVQWIRENPEALKAAIRLKKIECDVDGLVALDQERRRILGEAERLRAEQKVASQAMVALPKGSAEFDAKRVELQKLSADVKYFDEQVREIESQWEAKMLTVPNPPHASVPVGQSEADNQVYKTWGDVEAVSPHALPHFDIPRFGQWIDFPRGVKVTGAGFPFYVGKMAKLVRGLLHFFLEEAEANGYVEMLSPHVVNQASATATGQLPDKEGQMYVDQKEDLYLIPTAEVPVTNFYRDEIFEESSLPVKCCGHTPCFRREAGSWGAHVRGLNRLHQFDKVELVKWVHPEKSFDELELLRDDAERILQKLQLPYRVLLMCTADIGFAQSKKYDLEVWAGGQKRWLEVSSCSNFTDFQARRAGIRFRPKDGSKVQPVHTLNGSGLAVPRVLAALLENNLQADGRVKLPEVLHPFFGDTHL